MLGGGPIREAAVTTGLILVVFLAALVAFFWARLRRRLGMNTTGQTWLTVMAVFVLIALALWASSHR
jgi:fumarate reductase subunit D